MEEAPRVPPPVRPVQGAGEEDVPIRAWYGTATCILTGEDKVVESRIIPARPFDGEGGWGAVELAFRVAGGEIDDDIQNVAGSLIGQSREVTSVTAGVNWWATRNVRISANVVREDYHDDIDFGSGRTEDSRTGFLMRFQIDF
jgi:phosphate-selective porin